MLLLSKHLLTCFRAISTCAVIKLQSDETEYARCPLEEPVIIYIFTYNP